MTVTERRLVSQDWYETEYSKTGWDSNGWYFLEDGNEMNYTWIVVGHLDSDKHYNPILGIAEKETEIN